MLSVLLTFLFLAAAVGMQNHPMSGVRGGDYKNTFSDGGSCYGGAGTWSWTGKMTYESCSWNSCAMSHCESKGMSAQGGDTTMQYGRYYVCCGAEAAVGDRGYYGRRADYKSAEDE